MPLILPPGPDLPLGVLDLAVATGNYAGFVGTEVAISDQAVTFDTPGGRVIEVTVKVAVVTTAAGDHCIIRVRDTFGATTVNKVAGQRTMPNAGQNEDLSFAAVITDLAAGTHTLSLSGRRDYGSGTVTMVASGTNPRQLVVADLGPVPS